MLNEGHVTMLWQNLFRGKEITPETFKRAAELLDELRPESPLRFRLDTELDELRVMHQPEAAASKPTKRKKAAPKKAPTKRAKVSASKEPPSSS
jgi:hypothetical protein